MDSKPETRNSKHFDGQLVRGLTLIAAMSVVIGNVIGTGVFLKAAPMAQDVRTPTMVLLAWVAAH